MHVQTPFLRTLAMIFGGSLFIQLIGFLRQIVIAAAFGIDRSMDLYLLVLTVASLTSLWLSMVLDSASIPMITRLREAGDEAAVRRVSRRVLMLSLGFSIACTALFLAAVPLFGLFLSRGLDAAERAEMIRLSFWFLPWIALAPVYSALASLTKARERFRRFMLAELIVTLSALALVLIWPAGVHVIALSFGLGYLLGALSMLPRSGLRLRNADGSGPEAGELTGQVMRQLLALQAHTATALADRFFIAQLPAGTVAAGSYATLISGQISTFLGFKESFMVPLSRAEGRAEKLERLLAGLAVITVPAAAFLSLHAHDVIALMFQRGRFDANAVSVAGTMLAFQAVSLPATTALLPMYRMLQILDRMRYVVVMVLSGTAALAGSCFLLMTWLKLGLIGYLAAIVCAPYVAALVGVVLLRRAGIRLGLRTLGFFAVFSLAAASAAGMASIALAQTGWLADLPLFLRLLAKGCCFAACYGAACLLIRPRLLAIARGIGTE